MSEINARVIDLVLRQMESQTGKRLEPEHIANITIQQREVAPNPMRRLYVEIAPAYVERIKNFTIDLLPINLSQQMVGSLAAAALFDVDGQFELTHARLAKALDEHQGIQLYDDAFDYEVKPLSNGAHHLIVSASEASLLHTGKLVLFVPANPLEVLAATDGGTVAVATSKQVSEFVHNGRISALLAVFDTYNEKLCDQALFWNRRDNFGVSLNSSGQQVVGGPEKPASFDVVLEHDVTIVPDLYLSGVFEIGVINSQTDPSLTVQMYDVDANGDLILSYERVLHETSWLAIPVTAKSQVLRVINQSPDIGNAVVYQLALQHQRFLRQDVPEYRPALRSVNNQVDALVFGGDVRLESDLQEFQNGAQVLAMMVPTADLPTSGVANLISLRDSEGTWAELTYDADRQLFVGRQRHLEAALEIAADLDAVIQQVALQLNGVVYDADDAMVGFESVLHCNGSWVQTTTTDFGARSPIAGRIRVGGDDSAVFATRQFYHYRGYVDRGLLTWVTRPR